jgi:hypothetical protein
VGLSPPSVFQEAPIQHERSGPRRVLTQALDPEPQLGGGEPVLLEEVVLQPTSAVPTQATDSDADAAAEAESSSPKEGILRPTADLRTQATESDSDAEDAADAAVATAEADAVQDAAGADAELVKALQAAVRLRPCAPVVIGAWWHAWHCCGWGGLD